MLCKDLCDVLYCLFPYLQNEELKVMSVLCKQTNKIVNNYCSKDKTPIEELCRRGDLLIIYKRELLINDMNTFDVACEKGYENLIKRSIPYCDFGFKGIRRGSHQITLKFMIERCATRLCQILWSACHKGNRKIVESMIVLLQNDNNTTLAKYWDGGLYRACRRGHRKIVELMISLLKNNGLNNKYTFNRGLAGACIEGHREIVDLMIKSGATHCITCDKSIRNHKGYTVHDENFRMEWKSEPVNEKIYFHNQTFTNK